MNLRTLKTIFLLTLFISFPIASDRTTVKVGDDVTINLNEKVESVVVIGGDITIFGHVEESAVAIGGDIYIRKSGLIKENAVSIGGKVFIDPGGEVEGDIVDVTSSALKNVLHDMDFDHVGYGIRSIVRTISLFGILIIGLIGILLFPKNFENGGEYFSDHTWRILGWGLFAILILAPMIILLLITIIGIPLVPVLIYVYWLSFLGGYIAIGTLLGKRLFNRFNRDRNLVLTTMIGIFILWAGGQIPFLGWIVSSIIWMAGLGLLLTWLKDRGNNSKVKISG